MTSNVTPSSRRVPLCVQTQPIMQRSTGFFWSACAKNIPDKSRARNLGQQWKKKKKTNLIRTNVICRSTCGCVWSRKSIPAPSSSGHSRRIDRCVSLWKYVCVRALVVFCAMPVWICRCVPVCLGDFTVKRDPVCATLDVCNGCARGIGWSWPGAWGKPYWCEV